MGIIIYDGPSALDGSPVLGVVTGALEGHVQQTQAVRRGCTSTSKPAAVLTAEPLLLLQRVGRRAGEGAL